MPAVRPGWWVPAVRAVPARIRGSATPDSAGPGVTAGLVDSCLATAGLVEPVGPGPAPAAVWAGLVVPADCWAPVGPAEAAESPLIG